jgi:hypothetical protein
MGQGNESSHDGSSDGNSIVEQSSVEDVTLRYDDTTWMAYFVTIMKVSATLLLDLALLRKKHEMVNFSSTKPTSYIVEYNPQLTKVNLV